MKKLKTLLAALLALTIPVSAASLAACNNTENEEHKCGHVCPTCNKCTSDCTDEVCKDKCEGHEKEDETKITDGVYQRVLQGTRIHKIKLYENNTFYFESAMGDANKGTYEVKEESITYASYNEEDGTITDDSQWVTVTAKVLYFKNADGTPFTVNYTSQTADAAPSKSGTNGVADTGYKYGTAPNALALIDGKIINAKLGAYTRTLVQVPSIDFGIDDEMEIEQQKLMVAALPDGAPEDKMVQDYYISVSQNGFKSYLTGAEVLGTYTYSNNVYTLSNTISGESFGTLTIKSDGKATYVNGSTTIELVPYVKAVALVTLKGTKTITQQEQNTNVTFTLSLYENKKCELTNSLSDDLTVSGTWSVEDDEYTLTLGDGWTVTSATVSEGNLTVVCGGALGSSTITDLSLTGKVSGEAEVTEVLKKAWKNENEDGSDAIKIDGNKLAGSVTFLSDGTVKISVPSAYLNVTGKWTVVDHALVVTDIGNMTLTQSGLKLVLGGTVAGREGQKPVEATVTCTQAELGGLAAAAPAPAPVTEKLKKELKNEKEDHSDAVNIGGNYLAGSVTFYSDGTVNIKVTSAGIDVTGHYTAVSGQGLTVTDIGNMTLGQEGLRLVLGGTVTGREGPVNVSATFTCSQEELQGLLS